MVTKGTLGPLKRKAQKEGWWKWVRGENDERAVHAGYKIDSKLADNVVNFAKTFVRQSAGLWAGEPLVVLSWQYNDILIPAFGWVDEHGARLKRLIYIEIPKKNGKSTFGAMLGIYLLVADGEPGAEIYTAATKLEQARIIHDEACKMVKKSPELLKRLKIHGSTKCIAFERAESKYMAIPCDAEGIEGKNAHGMLMDELHVWKNRAYLAALKYAGAVRKQPIGFIFTTAGIDDPNSVGREEHDRAAAWIAGDLIDKRYHAVIYAAKKTDDPYKRATHKKANPSWEAIIDPEEIMDCAQEAKQRPSALYPFLRYRLNIWTAELSPWLDMVKWDASADPEFDESRLAGRECCGGLDLSTKLDLTGMLWVFPPTDDDPYTRVLPRFWCPRETATVRAKNDGVKYIHWADAGHITLTPGNVTDFAGIRQQIEADRARFQVRPLGIGADPWMLEMLRQELDPQGEYIVEFPQNYKAMTHPIDEVESLLADDKLRHDGNPVLRWCVNNVRLREDTNGNKMIDKSKSTEKVDGAIGLVMGVGQAMVVTPKPEGPTVTVIG